MKDRIGILTGGGDCPGLNAVIRAVTKAAARQGWETLGIHDGFEGLLDPVRYEILDPRNVDLLGTAADVYAALRQFPTALKLDDRSLEINPSNPERMALKTVRAEKRPPGSRG